VHVWLSIGIFSVLTVVILIGGMMLPGMTLGDYLSDAAILTIAGFVARIKALASPFYVKTQSIT
ncbi:MAG: hypothetical protein IJ972_03420, partial [Campylobacter sp.]|nr:hypothetical protein [Campylobacter sp.]